MPVVTILLSALGGVVALALVTLAGIRAFESRRLGRVWRSLESEEPGKGFSEFMIQDLPEPVQRYFCHAIRSGAPLYSRVSLKMSGRIKAGQNSPWMRFTATQILTPRRGFVWKARAWRGPVFLDVVDHYARGAGRMRVSLFGWVPIMNATGPDLSKSALGRLMAESVLVPSSLLPRQGVTWEAEDSNHIKATLTVEGEAATLNLTIDDEGGLQQVTLKRYGNPAGTGEWAYIPFGMAADGERAFNGYTIPSEFRGGWWYGTERYSESIQFTVDQAILG
jgi:hypothetical protein